MARQAVAIELSAEERAALRRLTRARTAGQGIALRARIVLAAAAGAMNKDVATDLGVTTATVGKRRRRFADRRLDGLHDEPRSGRRRSIDDAAVAAVVRRTLEDTPPDSTHWSLRSMAKAAGYAPATIHRIREAFGLQPHRTETLELSSDPSFVEKVRDVVGLSLDPPDRALVLCVDEKKPDTGPRSHTALAADAPRPSRTAHARLQAPRNNIAVRRPRRRHRPRHRALLPPLP